ncbi:extensin-like domain-containing protein [Aurantiacibacter poecillastricola]|uniref:extensin-like domain-containing protein n=1 Tax=Aurantiacibacter poecillastricola TaxID=3064385 RepID=UPI00273E1A71|nr:extensin family protein [Aurantiacibacter sp. 219JJ12-13]MDP5261898.1 extensin family protein [Aurantiacibacter sp. 219JJ12-13]
MARKRKWPRAPRDDRRLAAAFVILALLLSARVFLAENPRHNPWAPLDLRDERGWATQTKLAGLQGDIEACRGVLDRSEVAFTALPVSGEGECRRDDRLTLDERPFAPRFPQMTCPVAAGLELWLEKDVQPLAQEILGSRVTRVEQLGTYSCRRMYNDESAPRSEHATGNAIDIGAFLLEDGRRISVLEDWDGSNDRAAFLEAARDAACASFGTVLSPDYNAAHADHFHLDQGRRPGSGACR